MCDPLSICKCVHNRGLCKCVYHVGTNTTYVCKCVCHLRMLHVCACVGGTYSCATIPCLSVSVCITGDCVSV